MLIDWEALVPEAYLDADMLVYDAKSRPLMVGVVRPLRGKARFLANALAEDLNHLKVTRGFTLAYGMVVDPDEILVFRFDPEGEIPEPPEPACSLGTADVLAVYHPEFDREQPISGNLLLALIKAWLDDFSYRWKSHATNPPGAEALAEIGLAQRLKSSEVRPPVEIDEH